MIIILFILVFNTVYLDYSDSKSYAMLVRIDANILSWHIASCKHDLQNVFCAQCLNQSKKTNIYPWSKYQDERWCFPINLSTTSPYARFIRRISVASNTYNEIAYLIIYCLFAFVATEIRHIKQAKVSHIYKRLTVYPWSLRCNIGICNIFF